MNRFKFRSWHKGSNIMLKEDSQYYQGQVFQWLFYEYQNIDIMQWTGTKDENGTDIYECDIVKIWHGDYPDESLMGKVIWNLGGGYPAFDIYIPTNRHNLGWDAYSDEYNSFSCPDYYIKVIGNTYENPELLK